MNYLNKYLNWKVYFFLILISILGIILIALVLNMSIKKSINAILEVDPYKNMSLRFSTSNINLLSSQKDLSISLEGKIYFINDIEITYLGNNIYRINFQNEELYQLIKTNSTYDVNIFIGSKKILEYIFNI